MPENLTPEIDGLPPGSVVIPLDVDGLPAGATLTPIQPSTEIAQRAIPETPPPPADLDRIKEVRDSHPEFKTIGVSDDEIRQYLRDIGSFDDFKSVKDGSKQEAEKYAEARNKEESKMRKPSTWVVRRTITGAQAGTYRVFKYKPEALQDSRKK